MREYPTSIRPLVPPAAIIKNSVAKKAFLTFMVKT